MASYLIFIDNIPWQRHARQFDSDVAKDVT